MSKTTKKQFGQIHETAKLAQELQRRLFRIVAQELQDDLIENFDKHDMLSQVRAWRQTTEDELDQQVDMDKPVRVLHKEPSHQPGVYMNVGTGSPPQRMVRTPRARIIFDQITSPKYVKNVDELHAHPKMLDQFAAGLGRDLSRDLSKKTFDAFDQLVCKPGEKVPESGEVQNFVVADAAAAREVLVGKTTCKYVGTEEALDSFLVDGARDDDAVVSDVAPAATVYEVPDHLLLAYEFLHRPELHIALNCNDVEFYAWMSVGAVIYSTIGLLRISWAPEDEKKDGADSANPDPAATAALPVT